MGPAEALDEILRVIDGHDRGELFGDDEVGSLPLLLYIADVARRGKATSTAPPRRQGE